MKQTEVLKCQMTEASLRARSLARIRRQPSKLEVPGSNPGAPATFLFHLFLLCIIPFQRVYAFSPR